MSSFCAPLTIALQDSLSMGFSRQEYWNVQPFPSPGDLPDPIKSVVEIKGEEVEQ